ncbi:MAG: hypothetical protein HY720_25035 [Planctomycetes bacterium]|nr:hypothetical protein [Planctomycetota bacterium]
MKLGRPVVGLATPSIDPAWLARGRFERAATPEAAVARALVLARGA